MGISNFINLNNLGVINTKKRYQKKLVDLSVEKIEIQSEISKLKKIHKELTNMWRSVKPNKTNYSDKLTSQEETKIRNNAIKMINSLGKRRNKVKKLINVRTKKLNKMRTETKKIKNDIRYYST